MKHELHLITEWTKNTNLFRTVHNQNSIENWVSRAAEGDQKAQRHIYNELSGVLYSICLRYMGNEDDAKDVFQEGFVKLLDSLKMFRFDGSFEGWAKRIMVNMALTHLRKRKPMAGIEIENSEEITYDQDVLSKMSADHLLRLIRELPDGYREVFSLFAVEGYSHKEIAEMLNISEGNSKLRMNRARKMLQTRVIELMQVA